MKTRKWMVLLLPALIACSGCARHYVITMNSGSQYYTYGKPHLENGYYVFKDASGRERYVWGGQIREIAPASMASEDEKSQFNPVPAK